MARPTGNFQQAIRQGFARWYDPSSRNVAHDRDNNSPLTFANSTDTTSIPALMADTDSRIQIDQAAVLGQRQIEQFYFNAAAGLVTQCFFVASRAMTITGIEEIHSTAGTDGSAVTAVVTHDLSGQAPGAGTVVMTNTFNLKGTANTVQTATLLAVDPNLGNPNTGLVLAAGDRLTIKVTGVVTSLAGVVLTVFSVPGAKEITYSYNMQANGSIATQSFALANRDLVATSVWMTWSAAATNGGTVTADVTIETGTTAPGAGTSILAAAQSVKLTANVPLLVPLSATAANLLMRAGNRLSVKMTGTLTTLAGLVVAVTLGPVGGLAYIGENEATWTLNANGSLAAAQGFFIADRDYQVLDASAVWATAGTDGGTVSVDITIDKGVVAPGSGSSILSAAVSVKTTANTTAVLALNASRRQLLLSRGDLLSVSLNGVLTSLAGVTATVSLQPR